MSKFLKCLICSCASLFLFFQCESKKLSKPKEEVHAIDSLSWYPTFLSPDLEGAFESLSKEEKNAYNDKLAHYFKYHWELNDVSGGVLVAKHGEILFEQYMGYANRATKDTLTAETPIHIASISKVLTALVILKLVEKGQLSLEQDIETFFHDFPYKGIKLRDLLTHRSGLPNYAYFPHNDTLWNTKKVLSNQDILTALMHSYAPSYNPPNTAFSYCNTNYALLALIVEQFYCMPFPEAMQYVLFEPLGMKNTFVFEMKDSARVSQSYTYRNRLWEFNELDAIYGDKNVYSTPRDLLKLDRALYSDDFLSAEIKAEMFKGYSHEHAGIKNYGLGIRMMEWDPNTKILYHNGWWHGNYTTYVRAFQDTLTIIGLGNRKTRAVYSAFSVMGLLGPYPLAEKTPGIEENSEDLDTIKTNRAMTEPSNDSIKKDKETESALFSD